MGNAGFGYRAGLQSLRRHAEELVDHISSVLQAPQVLLFDLSDSLF